MPISRDDSHLWEDAMKSAIDAIWRLQIWPDNRGQDLVEYALMTGFVAVAAGTVMSGVTISLSEIFSKIASTMTAVATSS
jgi:Flp pilus assembly pilin Flp